MEALAPDVPFHYKQIEHWTNSMNFRQLFSDIGQRQLRAMTPERWESNKMNPTITLVST